MTDTLSILKDFWEDEMVATQLYKFLAKKASKEKVDLFLKISEMEKAHAEIWNKIAEIKFSVKFKPSISLKIKAFFMKLLAIIMPLTFMVYYLELDERSAVLNYSKLLEVFEDDEEQYTLVKRVIKDEIDHESQLVEMLLGETSFISKAKDAIYGMTDSLVEILALVIGLAGFTTNPLIIGLAGLISSIGGTFSMTSGAYLSTKSQNDIYEGKVREIEVKEIVSVESLKESLERGLREKGVSSETAKHIVEIIGDDTNVLKNLVKSLNIEESYVNPKEAAITTGVYYILGALPAIIPFFIPLLMPLTSVHAAIIAVIAAAIVSFFSGIFTAVLSGISIKKKAFENVVIIIGAAFATYLIGSLARMFLGIEI